MKIQLILTQKKNIHFLKVNELMNTLVFLIFTPLIANRGFSKNEAFVGISDFIS